MNTPTLQTDRLILRPFRQEDALDVFECWESDPDVAKYMFWTSHNDIEKTKEWIQFEIGQIEKDDWYRFALILKDTNELIGTTLIYYEEEVACWEIGYNLGKKYWGKGYTTEAMKKVIEFAVEELGLSQIVGRYAKENPASGNVMKKLGFQYEKAIPYECNDGLVKREGVQCRLVINTPKLRNMTSIYLLDNDKMLLLYRQGSKVVNNVWIGSAGGHFEECELNDPKACVLRELKEELAITEDMLSDMRLRYITIRRTNGEIRQNYYFFANLKNAPQMELTSDEGILRWFELDELAKLEMPLSAKLMIEHYMTTGRHNYKVYVGVTDDFKGVFTELPET